jgi:Alginate lyase
VSNSLSRRSFLASVATAPLLARQVATRPDLPAIERSRVLTAANRYLHEPPVTITSFASPRSAGGPHDYFSEGDYWWPDPEHPDGPYIQKDGLTNPDNFVAHRHALIRLSLHVPALAAAWKLTRDQRYARHAVDHLRAWFIDEKTRMNPSLLFAQAIKGRFTGRGIGIIDTIHLVEVVRAIGALEPSKAMPSAVQDGVRDWFARYVTWMTTHEYGQAERDAKNNHGTCWVMQVAEFGRYTGRADLTSLCRERFKTVIVPGQIAADGSFPEELRRTKPYGYSLFNMDAVATVCQILSTTSDNLWTYTTADGRNVGKALAFLVPYIADKKTWPQPPDVMYFDQWPVRHCLLLFGGLALGRPEYVALWRTLNPDPTVEEVIRNYFIRQPLLWIDRA